MKRFILVCFMFSLFLAYQGDRECAASIYSGFTISDSSGTIDSLDIAAIDVSGETLNYSLDWGSSWNALSGPVGYVHLTSITIPLALNLYITSDSDTFTLDSTYARVDLLSHQVTIDWDINKSGYFGDGDLATTVVFSTGRIIGNVVPIPASGILMGSGLLGLIGFGFWWQRQLL